MNGYSGWEMAIPAKTYFLAQTHQNLSTSSTPRRNIVVTTCCGGDECEGKTPDGEQVGLSSPPFSPSQESDNEASLMVPSQSYLVRRSPRTAKLEMIEMMQSIQEWSDLT